VDPVGYGYHHVPEVLSGDYFVGFCIPFGLGKLARTVNGDKQGELPFFRADLHAIDMDVADRIGLEPLLRRLLAGHGRYAADVMPLQTAMKGRSSQVRQCRLPSIEAVIQRQQRVSTKGHDQCFFLQRQYRRVALLRPYWGIMDVGAFLPLRYRLWVSIAALGQLR
jgi:hypothetical protein